MIRMHLRLHVRSIVAKFLLAWKWPILENYNTFICSKSLLGETRAGKFLSVVAVVVEDKTLGTGVDGKALGIGAGVADLSEEYGSYGAEGIDFKMGTGGDRSSTEFLMDNFGDVRGN